MREKEKNLVSPEKSADCLWPDPVCQARLLDRFFRKAAKDPRINCVHIGLYAALIYQLSQQDNPGALAVYSHEMIGPAKFSCRETYYKYIRELSEYGYIRYEPSNNNRARSKVYFVESG